MFSFLSDGHFIKISPFRFTTIEVYQNVSFHFNGYILGHWSHRGSFALSSQTRLNSFITSDHALQWRPLTRRCHCLFIPFLSHCSMLPIHYDSVIRMFHSLVISLTIPLLFMPPMQSRSVHRDDL